MYNKNIVALKYVVECCIYFSTPRIFWVKLTKIPANLAKSTHKLKIHPTNILNVAVNGLVFDNVTKVKS